MLTAVLLAAAVTGAPPAMTEGPQEQAAYDALLRQQALAADAAFSGAPCPDASASIVATEVVTIAGHPEIAARRERVQVNGCGRSAIQNVNVARLGGDPPWRMVATLPGDSLANAQLQQQTWSDALGQARVGIAPDCREAGLGEVYVAARPGHVHAPAAGEDGPAPARGEITVRLTPDLEARRGELDMARAWAEVWPFRMCGRDRVLGVAFLPLRDGTGVLHMFLPIWRQIQEDGSGAPPAPAPPK